MMDMWDFMMMKTIFLFIGSIFLSGGIAWAWKRIRPVVAELFCDWRAIRIHRRIARKKAEYVIWKEESRRFAHR